MDEPDPPSNVVPFPHRRPITASDTPCYPNSLPPLAPFTIECSALDAAHAVRFESCGELIDSPYELQRWVEAWHAFMVKPVVLPVRGSVCFLAGKHSHAVVLFEPGRAMEPAEVDEHIAWLRTGARAGAREAMRREGLLP